MHDSPASGHAEPLLVPDGSLRSDARRLFGLATVAAAFLVAAFIWVSWGWLLYLDARRVQEAMADKYRFRIAREQSWSLHEAERLAQQLELLFTLETDHGRRAALLTTFFTRLDPYGPFSAALIFDASGAAVFQRGCAPLTKQAGALLHRGVEEGGPSYLIASCDDRERLYAIQWQALWLGRDGPGRLLGAQALDQGWLHRLADPGDRLAISFLGRTWASSPGDADGLQSGKTDEPRVSFFTADFVQASLEMAPDAPTLEVKSPYVQLLPASVAAAAAIVGTAALIGALWLVMGRWLVALARDVLRLAEAAHVFRASFRHGRARSLLEPLSARQDELRQLADTLDVLMQETERRHEEERHHAITLALLDEAVLELDLDGRLLSASPAWKRIIGKESCSCLEGGSLSVCLHPDDRPLWDALLESFGRGEKLRHDVVLRLAGEDSETQRFLELRLALQSESHGLRLYVIARDVTEQRRHQERITHLALHDALTDLPNRALFSDRFRQATALARRQQTLLGVCMIDLDGFKPVNDRFGHAAGDRLLIEVALRLKKNLRDADTVARFGGDEFAVLLVDAKTVEEIIATIERLI